MKPLKILKSSFLIVGTVIGAGFITGKELLTFYGGFNVVTVIASLPVFAVLIFAVSHLDTGATVGKICYYAVGLINVVITAGMLACLDSLGDTLFGIPTKYSVLSVSFLVFSVVIAFNGITGLEKFGVIAVPFMVAVVVALCFTSSLSSGVVTFYDVDYSFIVYPSMNVFLSATVIKSSTENMSVKEKTTVAVVSATVLSVCMAFILASLSSGFYFDKEIPLFEVFSNNVFCKTVYSVALIIAVFTTLLGAYYTVYKTFLSDSVVLNVAFPVAAFILSKVGFSVIVGKLYPAISVLGLMLLALSFIGNRKFFDKRN